MRYYIMILLIQNVYELISDYDKRYKINKPNSKRPLFKSCQKETDRKRCL